MKIAFLFLVGICGDLMSQDWPLVRTNVLVGNLDSGIQLGAQVRHSRSGGELYYVNNYSVVQMIAMNYLSGRWLGPSTTQTAGIGVAEETIINASSSEVGSPMPSFLGNWGIALSGYVWGYEVVHYEPKPPIIATTLQSNFAPGRTNLLFGFKLFEDGNPDIVYYGWVELLRDRGDAVSQFRLGRHAVDYLPNRGIRAGREPERPALVSVVTPETTTLSWDPLYAVHGFVLERAESLTPPVTWEPVETPPGATNFVFSNTNSTSALFRLARP